MKARTPTMTLTSRTLAMGMVLTTTITLIGCSREGAAAPSWAELQASASASATTTPAASASATPSTSPGSPTSPVIEDRPDTADKAIDAATRAAKGYWAVGDQIMNELGKNPERINPVSTGPAQTSVHEHARTLREVGPGTRYDRTLEVLDAYATERTEVANGEETNIPNGFVGLTVCNDTSAMKYEDPRAEPTQKRSKIAVEVIYDSKSRSWKVAWVLNDEYGKPAPEC
jgi:hypothetical protein